MCAIDGKFSSITVGLSSVINRAIVSVYPPMNGMLDNCVRILYTVISPRRHTLKHGCRDRVYVLWTRVSGPFPQPKCRLWLPNHFVPLLGNDQISSGSKTSSPISNDSPSPHFITSSIKSLPTNNEENEYIKLTGQKTTVNEEMLITDNATSPLTIGPPAKVSSSENADSLSDPESDEPGTN